MNVVPKKPPPESILRDHFRNVENLLRSQGSILKSSGNSVNQGLARESFVGQFLMQHLGSSVGIGTGEIIDRNSKAGEARPQIDVIIYNKDFPKIHYSNQVDRFLAESVIATIEVKSTLKREGLCRAIETAQKVKSLQREVAVPEGLQEDYTRIRALPTSILSYVVAYKGPDIHKLPDMVDEHHTKLGIAHPQWSDPEQAPRVPTMGLDGVFILGNGYMLANNSTFGPIIGDPEEREKAKKVSWFTFSIADANLWALFCILTAAATIARLHVYEPVPYINSSGILIAPKGWYYGEEEG